MNIKLKFGEVVAKACGLKVEKRKPNPELDAWMEQTMNPKEEKKDDKHTSLKGAHAHG